MRRCTRPVAVGWYRAFRKLVPVAVPIVAIALILGGGTLQWSDLTQQPADAASPCSLAQVAFCDTFDAPSPNGAGTRSGDLDGVVWGVSRATSDDNASQHRDYTWQASQLNACGNNVTVAPPRDVQICNGQVVESVSDAGAVTVLAMYPRQPFDFAGRTGTVVFDVGNDTQGSHMAWPEFVLSDQPVPAPFEDASGVSDFARNSFGVGLGSDCLNNMVVSNGQGDSFTVSSMFTTSNYAFHPQSFTFHGCVKKSPGVGGPLNHVEIRMSSNHVEVWATNPGSTTLVELASGDFSLPLTRGLPWMEDIHYNANKEPGTQGNHTFAWDNFGFDGPVLARDLGFDVPDANQNFTGSSSIGYFVAATSGLTLPINGVHNSAGAAAALLEFTWWPHTAATMTVSLNGNPPHAVPWPYGSAATFKSQTLAIPIPLSEIHDGTNTVSFSSTDVAQGGVSIANIDLILAGAGAGGTGGDGVSGSVNTPTPTRTPTATATSTLRAATSTPTATSTPRQRATSTPTATPTQRRATATPTRTPTSRPATATSTPTPRPLVYTTTASVSPTSVQRGGTVTVSLSVTASATTSVLVDLEIYDPAGKVAFQRFWDNQSLVGGQPRNIATTWTVPQSAVRGTYTVKIGVFGPGWTQLRAWNDSATSLTVR